MFFFPAKNLWKFLKNQNSNDWFYQFCQNLFFNWNKENLFSHVDLKMDTTKLFAYNTHVRIFLRIPESNNRFREIKSEFYGARIRGANACVCRRTASFESFKEKWNYRVPLWNKNIYVHIDAIRELITCISFLFSVSLALTRSHGLLRLKKPFGFAFDRVCGGIP